MKTQQNLDFLLCHHEDGKVSVRWIRLAIMTLSITVILSGFTFAQAMFTGIPFSLLPTLALAVVMVSVWLLGLYFAKRKAEKKPARQVSMRALLAGLTAITVFLSIISFEYEQLQRDHAARAELESQLAEIVGEGGSVSVSGNPAETFIRSPSSNFNDDDLQQVLSILENGPKNAKAPVRFLDLSNTQVTDAGVTQLVKLNSLEYLYLDQTLVTDVSIDLVQKLDNLKLISVRKTAVSAKRLLELKQARKQLGIEPQTFQTLAPTTSPQ